MTVEIKDKPQIKPPISEELEERRRRAVQMHLQFFLRDESLNGVQIEPLSSNEHTKLYSVTLPGRAIVIEGKTNEKGALSGTKIVLNFPLTEATILGVLSVASDYLRDNNYPSDYKPEGSPLVTPKTTDINEIKKGNGLEVTQEISGPQGKVGAVVGPLKLDGGWRFVPGSFIPL